MGNIGIMANPTDKLLQRDEAIRREADALLYGRGLHLILAEYGTVHLSGSYALRLMTWRDLDFERTNHEPDMKQHWDLGAKIAQNRWVWSLHCIDAYHDPRHPGDEGLYWGLRLTDPSSGEIWKIDLWTARPEEFERATPKRPLWESKLNEDSRYCILAIKEAVCALPQYRNNLLSVHIYEAVLENDIRSINEFWDWWRGHYDR
jgi:hypothetical protein